MIDDYYVCATNEADLFLVKCSYGYQDKSTWSKTYWTAHRYTSLKIARRAARMVGGIVFRQCDGGYFQRVV